MASTTFFINITYGDDIDESYYNIIKLLVTDYFNSPKFSECVSHTELTKQLMHRIALELTEHLHEMHMLHELRMLLIPTSINARGADTPDKVLNVIQLDIHIEKV